MVRPERVAGMGACSTAGLPGHRTDAATSAWAPVTHVIWISLVGVWPVPRSGAPPYWSMFFRSMVQALSVQSWHDAP